MDTDSGRVTTVNGDAIALLLHDCGDHGYTSSILDEIGPRCVEQRICVATGSLRGRMLLAIYGRCER